MAKSNKQIKSEESEFSKIDLKKNIFIKSARVHNLKNVSVQIPRNKLIVVTGVSGSGKSSLTIDTLFAEGQRKYAESLSAYARQFMQRMDKPDVDSIKGLCPAIAIEQKVITRTPRSTVGSMTEIYDYLRLLYARIGKTISPISGAVVKKDDVSDVVHYIQQLKHSDKVLLLVAFKQHHNRKQVEELNVLLQKGISRLYINETIFRIEDILNEEKKYTLLFKKHPVYILIDRFVVKEFDEDDLHRIADSVNAAFYEGDGVVTLEVNGTTKKEFNNKFELDGIKFEEPVPNLFSFNNPYGACPTCEGFSMVLGIDEDLVIPNKQLSVYESAISPWKGEKLSWYKDQFIKVAAANNFPIHKPIMDLTKEQMDLLWKGNKTTEGINDFFKEVEANLYKVQYRVMLSRYRGKTKCTDCNGFRLRKEALYVKVNDRHIGELCEMPVVQLADWFNQLTLNEYENQIAKRILIEIHFRIKTLLDVGLGYLTFNRLANSLSGGESQRIQLTRSLGSNLTNSLYILDEPSIGLHSRDTQRLIKVY
jgi:excinuclease ABC subunit A